MSRKRIAAVELREGCALEERRDIKRSLQTLTETQATLARTVDRLASIFYPPLKLHHWQPDHERGDLCGRAGADGFADARGGE